MTPALLLAAKTLNFAAQVEPWQASCAPLATGAPADCGTPTAATGAPPATLDLSLILAAAAGQAQQTQQAFASGAYAGLISLYSVYPEPSTGFPPYIQVRIDLSGPARATCAESVRLRDPMELPPVICAAFEAPAADGSSTQAGVTISFTAQ